MIAGAASALAAWAAFIPAAGAQQPAPPQAQAPASPQADAAAAFHAEITRLYRADRTAPDRRAEGLVQHGASFDTPVRQAHRLLRMSGCDSN
jgi:hypothetical protein